MVPGQVPLIVPRQEHVIERRDLPQVLVFATVYDEKRAAVALLVVELHMHHAVVVFVGVRIEQYAIDNTEDSGGGTDAQHQGENRGDDETRRLAKLAKGEAQVLQKGPHGCLRN